MEYYIQKIILCYLQGKDISTIIDRGLQKQFDVLLIDKYWKREAIEYLITTSPIGINYYRKIHKLCMNCGRHGAELHFPSYILCKKCTKKNEYKLISRESAHIKYGVNDNELLKIKNIVRANYNYNRRPEYPKKYYLEREVRLMINEPLLAERKLMMPESSFCRNYYSREAREDYDVYGLEDDKKRKRRNELMMALKKYGLTLREDSIICNKYICGNIEKNIDEIVEKMCTMKYLFEYTDYSNIMRKLMIKKRYTFVAYNNHEFRAIGKKQALEDTDGNWPESWPWLS